MYAQAPINEWLVEVFPNPSNSGFGIQVISNSHAPIVIRLMDVNGRKLSTTSTTMKDSQIKVGGNLKAGTYFAEVIQGNLRKVVKLFKVN